jgi:hypothetical protein
MAKYIGSVYLYMSIFPSADGRHSQQQRRLLKKRGTLHNLEIDL